MRSRSPFPFHPFLLALHPVLCLYSSNAGEVALGDLVRPVAATVTGATFVFVVFGLVLRDKLKAGLAASLAALAFFLYGPFFEALNTRLVIAGLNLGRNTLLLPAWLLAAAVGLALIARTKRNLRSVTTLLNVVAAALIAVPILTVAASGQLWATRGGGRGWTQSVASEVKNHALSPKQPQRDIYYIILDQYGRSDTLKRYFDCDNSDFTSYLKKKGFYVAEQSPANYFKTYSSLAASLNMDYVQTMARGLDRKPDAILLGEMIRESRVMHLLKDAGYKFLFFPSAYHVTWSNRNADMIFSSDTVRLNEFERTLLSNSALLPFMVGSKAYRTRTLYALDQLAKVPEIKGPKFTFVHIVCPHPPYVFDVDGNLPALPVGKQDFEDGEWRFFAQQVHFMDRQMKGVVESIIKRSETAPIIIIQGDHGPVCKPNLPDGEKNLDQAKLRCRGRILNAYYLPNDGDKTLYPSISPVNSFRVVFNDYFGAGYRLLKDASYEGKSARGRSDIAYERVTGLACKQ